MDKLLQSPGKFAGQRKSCMGKKIYVGNLSYNTYEDGLRALFQNYGTVASAKIITDRDSGQSRVSASSRWAPKRKPAPPFPPSTARISMAAPSRSTKRWTSPAATTIAGNPSFIKRVFCA